VAKTGGVIADCALYVHGEKGRSAVTLDAAFECLDAPDALVWIELVSPTNDEVEAVAAELNLHPLVVEDAGKPHQRPKLEMYPNSAFLVLKTVSPSKDPGQFSFGELQIVVGPQFIVTIRHGEFDPVAIARTAIDNDPAFFRHGVPAVMYALADAVVDRYEVACDEIEASVDEIEATVFAPGSKNAAELIFQQKRSTLTFVRNVSPLLEVIGRLATHRSIFETPDAVAPYFRDVADHLSRVQSRLDQSRELLTAALEANLAQISIRQNEDMRAMSGWAAIIAVPTLFAGIWGMNFQHMPELDTFWGYPLAIGTIVASSYAAYRRLKRNGWL
jgi:magnesium transporter